jgi:hypothetical protein
LGYGENGVVLERIHGVEKNTDLEFVKNIKDLEFVGRA